VGKTSIFRYHEYKTFEICGLATRGIDNLIKKAEFPGDSKKYTFKIYDTAGEERFKSISLTTVKMVDGILLVFSLNNIQSFEKINEWIENIENIIDLKEKVVILIGNLIDSNNRKILKKEAEEFSKKLDIKYREVSPKTGFGIDEVFQEMYNDIYEKFKSNMHDNNENKNIHLSKNKFSHSKLKNISSPKLKDNSFSHSFEKLKDNLLLSQSYSKIKNNHLSQIYTLNKFLNY